VSALVVQAAVRPAPFTHRDLRTGSRSYPDLPFLRPSAYIPNVLSAMKQRPVVRWWRRVLDDGSLYWHVVAEGIRKAIKKFQAEKKSRPSRTRMENWKGTAR